MALALGCLFGKWPWPWGGCLLGKWPWPWGACWTRCLEGLDGFGERPEGLEGFGGFGGFGGFWRVLEGGPTGQVPHLRWSQAPPRPWRRPGSADLGENLADAPVTISSSSPAVFDQGLWSLLAGVTLGDPTTKGVKNLQRVGA